MEVPMHQPQDEVHITTLQNYAPTLVTCNPHPHTPALPTVTTKY